MPHGLYNRLGTYIEQLVGRLDRYSDKGERIYINHVVG